MRRLKRWAAAAQAGCLLACWMMATQSAGSEEPEPSPARILPTVNFAPGSEYADQVRMFQGIPGLERAANGRLWATWYGGGVTKDRHNYVMLVTSEDNGQTWSDLKLVIDPDGPGPVRAFDPCPWIDPDGKLWLFWCQATRGGGGDPFTLAITTPTKGRNRDTLADDLVEQGFSKGKLPEFLLFNEANAPGNVCTTYQKVLEAGETLELGKWDVVIF